MNSFNTVSCAALALIVSAGAASAQTWPQMDGGMKHILIAFDGTTLTNHIDNTLTPDPLPLPMRTYGESYTAPADVLDGKYYSSQFGFLADGFITLDPGTAIWIEMTSATPGLEAYEGGMRPMRAMHTYAPIFGTAGSDTAWKWNGMMHHPWFAANDLGLYSADFNIYIGDDITGAALSGYTPSTVTLEWNAVPAPGSLAVLGLGGLVATRRRR